MAPEAQLEWESRAGRAAGAAAILSAAAGLGGFIYANASLSSERANDSVDGAFAVHRHHGDLIVSAVAQAVGVILFAVAIAYLYRATRYRRPELRPQSLPLLVVGSIGYAAALIGVQFAVIHAEDGVVKQLVAHPLKPKDAVDLADHSLTKGAPATWTLVLLGMGLLLGAGVALISQAARRTGLLSNFMGVLGIIVGVLLFIPIFGRPPIIEYFWVVALGFLFLGRWPQGRGPAWETGEAVPWPTAAELREQREAESGGGGDGRRADRATMRRLEKSARRAEAEEPDESDEVADDDEETAQAAAAHPRSKKRKRKRRR